MASSVRNDKKDEPLAIGESNNLNGSYVVASLESATVNVFFDGTGNNQQNTLHRLKNEPTFKKQILNINNITNEIVTNQEKQRELLNQKEQLPRGNERNRIENCWHEINYINRELVFKREKIKEELQKNDLYKLRGETSYQNDFTNIALLEMAIKKTPLEPIYIQGAGTIEGKTDLPFGLGMAIGESGVVQRVNEAFEKVANLIIKYEIKRLKLNVFGFSRGAFYARVFCAWMKTEKIPTDLSDHLDEYPLNILPIIMCAKKVRSQIHLDIDDIQINLVGIIDTVSSYRKNHYDNPEKIAMNIGGAQDIYRVIHFTAQNEYRYHFPLTPIDTALNSGCGLEFSFPGAHSNIGGSYTDNYPEKYHYLSVKNNAELMPGKVSEIPPSNILFNYPRDGEIPYQWWVKKGYYTEDTLRIRRQKDEKYKQFSEQFSGEVFAHRKVRHHYQYIYLNAMKYFAEKIGNIHFSEKNKEYQERQEWFETRKLEDPQILGTIDAYIQETIQKKALSLGTIDILAEDVFANVEACQALYKNYIFNSLMPIPFKLIGHAKGGLDENDEWAILPGVANEGNSNNLDSRGIPKRPIISGG